MSDLSPGARALFEAAKSDGPSAASRAQMWGAVSTATGAAVTVAAAATAGSTFAVVTATSSGKLLAVGALFGSVVTLGLALVAFRGGPTVVPRQRLSPETEVAHYASRTPRDVPPIPLTMEAPSEPIEEAAPKAPSRPVRPQRVVEDALMREAALVADARGALARSDAEAALKSLDAARRVGSRDLEPEELSLRAHALRALGRTAEADETEGALRSRYPDHFLSR